MIDWANSLIHVTEPQVEVDLQSLYDWIEDQQSVPIGIHYDDIVSKAEGKAELKVGEVYTGITITLSSPWQLRFWDGQYVATVDGGNLVGGLGNQPIAFTPNVQVLILQSEASTIVYSSTASTTNRVFQYNASDDGSTVDIGVWIVDENTPVLNIESMSVKIYTNDGVEVANLGTQTVDTGEGVFRFSTPSTNLSSTTSYYLNVIAIQGLNTWSSNLGLTTA